MSKQLSNGKSNLPANIANIGGLAQSIQDVGGAFDSGVAFMAFRKTGEWEYGLEEVEADPAGTWLINPGEFMHGWVAWDKANRSAGPVGEVMVPSSQALPAQASLAALPPTAKWAKSVSIKMKAITGEDADDGAEVVWKTNSKGGLKAYAQLVSAFLQHYGEINLDERQDVCPIVQLKNSSYKHPEYGKIFTPILEIVGWADIQAEAAAEPEPEEDEPVQEEVTKKPARRRRRVAK